MPVAAVSCAGRPRVSAGSQMAALGTTWGEMTPTLRPSSRIRMAPRPTSLPVPAVVGTAITGAVAGVMRAKAALDHRKAFQWTVVHGTHGHTFGQVDRRAPTNGDDPVTATLPNMATASRTAFSFGLGGVPS